MAAPAEPALWPWEKFEAGLQDAQLDGGGRGGGGGEASKESDQLPAVVVRAGVTGLADLGQVVMMEQARVRLQRAGFQVLGGWLSLASPIAQAAQADEQECSLSTEFRLALAEQVVSDSDFVALSPWEARQVNGAPSPVDLTEELRAAINDRYKAPWAANLRIFLVCGPDDDKLFNRPNASDKRGFVMVPRSFENFFLEKPIQLAFIADMMVGMAASTSSAKLRLALKWGDSAFVSQVVPPSAAQLLLHPTEAQKASFEADLEKLAPVSQSMWPNAKLMQHLPLVPEDKFVAVLVAVGLFGPMHHGDLAMMWQARERLERAGYAVVAGWLLPLSDVAAPAEASACQEPEVLSGAFRRRVAELSVCDDSFLSAGSWELGSTATSPARPLDLASELQRHLTATYQCSFEGQRVRVFYVGYSDTVLRRGIVKGLIPTQELGVVVVPRDADDDHPLESPTQLFYVADPPPDGAGSLGASKLREAVAARDQQLAAGMMAAAAARFVLQPTASEHAELKADFDLLGVSLPTTEELDQAVVKLKDSFRSISGDTGFVATEDVARLLKRIDPAWTKKDMDTLLAAAAKTGDGRVSADDFIDWLFHTGR